MRHIDEKFLASGRVSGHCEVCGKWCKTRCFHHVFPRGSGRLDIPANVVCVGMNVFLECLCHNNLESMPPAEAKRIGLGIIAKRERTTPEAIDDVITILRQFPKRPPLAMVNLRLGELTGESHALASRVFGELGLL